MWGTIEWIVTLAIVGFLAVRLGPQIGALTGIAPYEGTERTFTVETLDGERIRSEDLEGRVVVVNFWATWCAPCRLEMPSLQAVHEDLSDEGVTVLGLSTDVGGTAPIRAFLEERSITFPVGRATRDVRGAFDGIRATPTTIILDREGVERHRVLGYFAPPAMRAAVRRLLREERAPAEDAAGATAHLPPAPTPPGEG